MASARRRAFPAAEKATHLGRTPAQDAAPAPIPAQEVDVSKSASDDESLKMFIPITKASDDEQIITGVVLQPEVVDGQGDIYDAKVIKKAAHNFMAGYNSTTQLGLMHKDFKKRFELVESFLAPMDMAIGSKVVKSGSWIIVVRVLDKTIWKQVKDGKLTGFSIGGKAKAQKLTSTAA